MILLLIFLPLLFAITLMSPLCANEENKLRHISKSFSILHFIITTIIFTLFDYTNIKTQINWMNTLGINACFTLDKLSMLLCLLTSFITMVSIFISKGMIKKNYQLYYSLIFLLQFAVLGVFCSSDLFLFFLFWELELIPMYILILKWGSGYREKTAMKFLLYTFFGSLFLLFAFLIIYLYNYKLTGILTSNILELFTYEYPKSVQLLISIFLLIGFGVKLPIFPLHSWLPDAHAQAPTPVSILLSAILLKMGAYGLIKFNDEMFSDAFFDIAPILFILGIINLIYASICAIAQKDIKRIIAFSGIAHMGLFLIALSSFNKFAEKGAFFQIFSHALITTGLFIIAGIIYKKCGTKNINKLKGLGTKMPHFMFISIPIILASIGIPFTSGFIAEFLCFIGAFISDYDNIQILILIALASMILCSIYILKIFHSVFFGELPKKYVQVRDINIHQSIILIIIAFYIIFLGCFPSLLIGAL